jgi:eukaryotic-like serine/threonine-protein kinase
MLDSPIAPGELLAGKYRVERKLGEGGHGVVVAAEHIALGERVAIKLLRPEVAQDSETVTRFLREARASVRIKGEHVTRVLDVGSLESGTPYMVMEYLEGADLSNVVEAKGWLPVSLAVDYILQACEALAEAHALGIVHRDVKPSNLFLTTRADGAPCIKVLDFGISKAMPSADGAADLTQTQSVLGSPQYMAPEQMRSSKRVDARTDIWAIGTTLHELLTGRPPFEAQSMPELFAMILQDEPPRLSERRPEIPEALETIVARCLEKDPAKRFPDVHQLARALAPLGTSASPSTVERIHRVGVNTARSSVRIQLVDAGSAPGIDLSRTEKTGSPLVAPQKRAIVPIAAGALLVLLVGGATTFFAVTRSRTSLSPPKATVTAPESGPAFTPEATSPPPPASDPLPPTSVLPSSGETLPTASASSAPTSTTATTTTSTSTKKSDTRTKPNSGRELHGSASSAPSAPSATMSPKPTAPAPSAPSRAPGVASSRYD